MSAHSINLHLLQLGWILILALGCAYRQSPSLPTQPSRPATADEIVEFKKIYTEYLQVSTERMKPEHSPVAIDELRAAALQGEDRDLREYAVRQLTFHDDPKTRALLRHLVLMTGGVEQFYAACALAYQGRDDGLRVLYEAVAPSRVPMTSSGFEVSEGGMALAILGHEIPPDFANRPNPGFEVLDQLFE